MNKQEILESLSKKTKKALDSISVSLLEAGGQAAGKMEILSTSVDDAYDYLSKALDKKGRNLDEEIPNFRDNYLKAQTAARSGFAQRKDMPVITYKDVKLLQKSLKFGKVDINPPYSDKTDPGDPFPEGLSGQAAEDFLKNGIVVHDGSRKDDPVKVSTKRTPVGKLQPLQAQIYFDKAVQGIIDFGLEKSKAFFGKTFFIISSDNFILDGHHRFLGASLIDPKMGVTALAIDLPIATLLPLTLAFGDAIGNKRNK